MKVKDVMHKKITWVEANTPIEQVVNQMRELDIGAIPVGDGDRLVGMITDRDIAIRSFNGATNPRDLKARDVMSKEVAFCKENENLDDALQLMTRREVRRLPVLNDEKRMIGMLSLGDIAHAASHAKVGTTLAAISSHHRS